MRISLVILTAFVLMACPPRKGQLTPAHPEFSSIQKYLEEVRIEYNTFESKSNISLENSEMPISNFSAVIRMKKDSIVWMSIRAMGIEGGRALITTDSFFLLDRMGKNYMAKPISILSEKYGVPADIKELQKLLMGEPVYFEATKAELLYENGYKKLLSTHEGMESILSLEEESNTIVNQQLSDSTHNRNANVAFMNYEPIGEEHGNKPFSMLRKFKIESKQLLEFELSFDNIRLNESINFSFSIPSKYTRLD